MNTAAAEETKKLSTGLIFVMALSAGCAVANGYYYQPLLPQITRDFPNYAKSIGFIGAAIQFGYAIGLLFFIPLGDRHERKTFDFDATWRIDPIAFGSIFFSLFCGFAHYKRIDRLVCNDQSTDDPICSNVDIS